MDKENFNFRPYLDPLKSFSINEVIRSRQETLAREKQLVKDRDRLIEQFKKYKERNKAE